MGYFFFSEDIWFGSKRTQKKNKKKKTKAKLSHLFCKVVAFDNPIKKQSEICVDLSITV